MASLDHVGIIPDGSRRWARHNGVPLRDAYVRALSTLEAYVQIAFQRGATAVSLYLVSRYNLDRSADDLDPFVEAGRDFLTTTVPRICREHDARAVLAGRSELLPGVLREAVRDLQAPADGKGRTVYLCAAYDAASELRVATARWVASGMQGDVSAHLWVPQPLDLVFRTGGATTLSDFLPFQAGYAQLLFVPDLFNDVSAEDFAEVCDVHLRKRLKRGV